MADIVARLRVGKLSFETMVDLDAAMKLRKGQSDEINEVIRDNAIYTDQKKGMRDRKSTRLNSSHIPLSRMPSSA